MRGNYLGLDEAAKMERTSGGQRGEVHGVALATDSVCTLGFMGES